MSSSDRNIPTSRVDDALASSVIEHVTPRKLPLHARGGSSDTLLCIGLNNFDDPVADDMIDELQLDHSDEVTVVASNWTGRSGEASMDYPDTRPASPAEATTLSDSTSSGAVFSSPEGSSVVQTEPTVGSINRLTYLAADLHLGTWYHEGHDGINSENMSKRCDDVDETELIPEQETQGNKSSASILDDPCTSLSELVSTINVKAESSASRGTEIPLFPWRFEFVWTSERLMFVRTDMKTDRGAIQTALERTTSLKDLSGSSPGSSSSVFDSTNPRALSSSFSNHGAVKPKHGKPKHVKPKHESIKMASPEQMERFFVYLTDDYVRVYKPNSENSHHPPTRYRHVNGDSNYRKLAPAPPASRPEGSRRRKLNSGSGDGSDDEGGDGDMAPTSYSIPTQHWRSFACPFIRQYPGPQSEFYISCAFTIKSIAYLKAHLRMVHRLMHCKVCLRVVDNAEMLAAHVQFECGKVNLPGRQMPFITDPQWARANKSFRGTKMLEQEQYQYIYTALFPSDRSTPNPYISHNELARMKEKRKYAREQAPRVLKENWPYLMSTPLVLEDYQFRPILKGWLPHAMAEETYDLGGIGDESQCAACPDPQNHTESTAELGVILPIAGPLASLRSGSTDDSPPVAVSGGTEKNDEAQINTHLAAPSLQYGMGPNRPSCCGWNAPADLRGFRVQFEDQHQALNSILVNDTQRAQSNGVAADVPDAGLAENLEVLENYDIFDANWPLAALASYEG